MNTKDFDFFLYTLEHIIQDIREEKTGNMKTFGQKYQLARPVLYRYLESLKNMGAEISYCSQRNSLCFEEEFRIVV